ncbi:MAG: signal peptide peptidase SppA [Planctomycetota bacterium]
MIPRSSVAAFAVCLLAAALPAFARQAASAPGQANASAQARVIKLSGSYEDNPSPLELGLTTFLGGMQKRRSFPKLLDSIAALGNDKSVHAVTFDLAAPDLELNATQLSELARSIGDLRDAGKRTFAWLENAGNVHYGVAAACDTIVMADLATLDIPSLTMGALYFRDAMDLVGIRATAVRVGKYKGAVEPFTLSEMSEHLRQHYLEMLRTMNDALVARLAEGRHLDAERMRELQRQRLFRAAEAKAAGLVDEVTSYGNGRNRIAELLGSEVAWSEPETTNKEREPKNFLELMRELFGRSTQRQPSGPAVVVLHLDGPIEDGEQASPGSIVSGPTVNEIAALADDANVRGVVVRVNSPGGSATASEAIRSALERLAARKPVVISMGEVAASGGYWITCIGQPIFADAGTITGSIGVLALKMNFGPLLNRIGVHIEDIALDDAALLNAIDRDWSDAAEKKIQDLIDEVYQRFLGLVSSSRHMGIEAVSAIAGGRVWSGAQAKKLGLVDHLAGLQHAVLAVAAKAGIDSYEVLHRPSQKNVFEMLDLFADQGESGRLAVRNALLLLRKHGFSLGAMLPLLRCGLERRAPTAWLLMPDEIVIR